jgi:ribosomal protein RSM22 (predicted rRNA methylase)
MIVELPPALRAAIERELVGVSRRVLAERAERLSAEYRAGGTSARAITGPADALAYALARLPATYAACAAVLSETRRMAPDFEPRNLLDAGAGPAGASWAATEVWATLEDLRLFDASRTFIDLAQRLAVGAAEPLRGAEALLGDLTETPLPRSDLVVASYALAEVRPNRLADAVGSLWSACMGVLALVEPGTPAGFERIRAARGLVIGQGGSVLAPCPHDLDCPLQAPDWCHFVQRLPRSRDHRRVKSAEAPFEDEKFAYLVAARPTVAAAVRRPRVLAPPRASKSGIELKLCEAHGVETRFTPRRDKPAHAYARRLTWGDTL